MQNLYCKKRTWEQILLNKRLFLNNEDCKELFLDKEIFVFGAGVDAEQFEKDLSGDVNIIAYIDNNRVGKNNYFCGKRIISLDNCLSEKRKKQPIVVTSYRYALEICNQLLEMDLLPGKDFFVWDEMCLFHLDTNTKEYIEFLHTVWGKYRKNNAQNKILVAFDNRHDLMSTIYAYCSNYFAEKYNAAIYAYFRYGSDYSNASRVIYDIYKAFNVNALIDTKLKENQKNEAEEILNSIWDGISTWEDWKSIKIYGINFGTTIIRDLLRGYIPNFNVKDKSMYLFLQKSVSTIVFWYHYIYENDIKVVLLADGVSWDGYIRDIAITKGIPTYAVGYKMAKATIDFCDRPSYPYFKEMWNQLTEEEQVYGIEWAKDHINKRLQGSIEEVFYTNKNNFTFAEKIKEERVLEENNKIKIIICPHIFEEDCYWCGEQIFDNNYFSWLCHLGELSEKTPNYDWYLKMHPFAQRRDMIIIDMLLKKYTKIKKIPSDISPIQLKKEGADFALTVYGTIGHEYPEIGIQVINAGINPHCSFDFNWNPKTKEEYDDLILNLGNLDKKSDEEGLYQFYSLNYLFYNWEYIPYRSIFFDDPFLAMDGLELKANGKKLGTWKYKEYIKEWNEEKHKKILLQLEDVFQKLDKWEPNILYKKEERIGEI